MPVYSGEYVGTNAQGAPFYKSGAVGKGPSSVFFHLADGTRVNYLGNPMATNDQIIAGGAIQALNTLTQALPTNGSAPLATSNAVAIPTTPASPMQAFAPAALAVINPNAYRQPIAYPPLPFYKDKTMMAGLAVGLVLVGFAVWRMRRR